ncbi:hypothetical protein LCGC14_2456530 [marine sediment metagenome]|uniref:Uncharacterized protein n=1 Tax=marine sediment metagenome TaxID=412755 RepID=A0A0F9DRQ6_9ZZZZ
MAQYWLINESMIVKAPDRWHAYMLALQMNFKNPIFKRIENKEEY